MQDWQWQDKIGSLLEGSPKFGARPGGMRGWSFEMASEVSLFTIPNARAAS